MINIKYKNEKLGIGGVVAYGLVISSLDDIYIIGEFDNESKKKDNFLIKFSKPSTTTPPIPSFSFLYLIFIIMVIVIIAEKAGKNNDRYIL
jgi:hypothetical protein